MLSKSKNKVTFPQLPNYTVLLIIILLILLSRWIPFYYKTEASLGYDTGFYLVMAKAMSTSGDFFPADISTNNGVEIMLPFFKLLSLIGFSAELITFGWHIIAVILLAIAIYLFITETAGKTAGLASAAIFALSLTQYEAYQYFLYRNTWALFFMFLAMWLIVKKSTLAFWPSVFLTVIHKSTPVIFFPVVLLYLLIKKQWKLFAVELLAMVAGGAYLMTFESSQAVLSLIQSNFAGDTHQIRSGDFISLIQFFSWSWPYQLLAIWWLGKNFKNKIFDMPTILFGLSTGLVLIQFIFYKRLIIYWDLAAILLGGTALAYLLKKYLPDYKNFFIATLIVIVSLAQLPYIMSQPQKISWYELEAIKKIENATEPNAYILNINSIYAPWLEGWSNRKTISPGLIRDKWNYEQWQQFWNNNDIKAQKDLLSMYNSRPLYLFIGDLSFGFTPSTECFKPVDAKLYRYACN